MKEQGEQFKREVRREADVQMEGLRREMDTYARSMETVQVAKTLRDSESLRCTSPIDSINN